MTPSARRPAAEKEQSVARSCPGSALPRAGGAGRAGQGADAAEGCKAIEGHGRWAEAQRALRAELAEARGRLSGVETDKAALGEQQQELRERARRAEAGLSALSEEREAGAAQLAERGALEESERFIAEQHAAALLQRLQRLQRQVGRPS